MCNFSRALTLWGAVPVPTPPCLGSFCFRQKKWWIYRGTPWPIEGQKCLGLALLLGGFMWCGMEFPTVCSVFYEYFLPEIKVYQGNHSPPKVKIMKRDATVCFLQVDVLYYKLYIGSLKFWGIPISPHILDLQKGFEGSSCEPWRQGPWMKHQGQWDWESGSHLTI